MHFSVAVISKSEEDVEKLLDIYKCREVEPYISCSRPERIERAKKLQKRALEAKNTFTPEFIQKVLAITFDEDMLEFDREAGTLYDEFDNELSTCSPLEKWDWYEIGGRWVEELYTLNKNYVSCEIIKNIDFSISPKRKEKFENQWKGSSELQIKFPKMENYINSVGSFRVFAILTPDGKWHEGLSPKNQLELILDQDENCYLTVIDAHF